MDKVAIFWDLATGLLIAIDIAAPNIGHIVGNWLIKHLPNPEDTVNPLQIKTLIVNLCLTIFPLSILVSYAMSKAMITGAAFQWSLVGLFTLGIVIGVSINITLTSAVLLIRRIVLHRHRTTTYILEEPIFSSQTYSHEASMLLWIWSASMVLGILALFLLGFATGIYSFLAAPILTFVITFWVFPTAMLWTHSFVKYVTANPRKPYYALARIGLLIFVISKVVAFIM